MNKSNRILIVDDDKNTCKTVSMILQKKGYDTEWVHTGKEALERVKDNTLDIVLMDLRLPDAEGTELIAPIKETHPECAVIMVTGYASLESSIEAMNAGASSYIVKPINMEELLLKLKEVAEKQDLKLGKNRAEEELKHTLVQLSKAMNGIIHGVVKTLEARDPYTAGHQRRVTYLSNAIAKELGLKKELLEGLHIAGMLHDIGKIHIPAEVLSMPRKLNETEFEIIKTHPTVGFNILKEIEFPYPVADIVHQHHERMDGSGYPQGLKSNEIRKEARILTVADVIEAMSSHRPYRPALGIDVALEEVVSKRSIHFDPEVVDVCIRLFREKGFTFENIDHKEMFQMLFGDNLRELKTLD